MKMLYILLVGECLYDYIFQGSKKVRAGSRLAPRAARVAQWFSAAFSPGPDLGDPDRVPRWAPCMEPASPSACVSAAFSLALFVSHQ